MTTKAGLTRWYLSIGLLGCAVYFALPRSVAAQAVFVVLAASAPIIGMLAMRRYGSTSQIAWRVLLVGFAIAALGEALEFIGMALDMWTDAGSASDIIFVTAYMVQLWGLMSLFRAQTASRHQFGWFDAAAVGVAVGTVVWTNMYDAIFGTDSAGPLDWFTRFGGAVLGVALVVIALLLVIGARGRRASLNLLLGAFLLQQVADSIAALWSGYAPGARVDALWVVAYVLMGTAMINGGQAAGSVQPATRLTHLEIKHTLVLQAGVTIVLATTIFLETSDNVVVASLVVWATAWLAIIVMTRVRVFGLLRMVAETSATENQRRLSAMVGSSNDVIGLADPDGTIRYITPSIERLTGVPLDQWIGHRMDVMLTQNLLGLEDFTVHIALLGPGESEEWECSVRPRANADARGTVKLTLANQLGTPDVNGWVITAQDITHQAQLTAELRHQSLHDTLTGLPNRGLLFDRIQHSVDLRTRADQSGLSLVLVDIDDFKSFNDSLGHATGDELLRAVAERLSASVRYGDTVARLGGDEFVILLEGTDEAEALVLAERALESLALPVQIANGSFAVRASAGVVCSHDAASPMELLRLADIAMYASKRDGKSKVTLFHPDMHENANRQFELRMDLSVALEHGELWVAYQPIIDTQANRICGAEALLRWKHPVLGEVSPAEFIPLAEQSGQIRSIGQWVLRTACAEASAWTGDGAQSYVSVNVSALQLNESFADVVLATLAETGLPAPRLMLEITESMLVHESASNRELLTRLRDAGARIAIDDFGTGFSSLAYLQSLCVDVVKIDRAFVRDVDTNSDHQALTRTILSLAEGFEMTAIAEGVETDNELAEINRLGCRFAQGFLFHRPLAPKKLRELFERSLIS